MKNFNIIHLSGYSALGLIVACLAQQWFGEHDSYWRHRSVNLESLQQTQFERNQASQEAVKLSLLRTDRQKEEAHQLQLRAERARRESAWQAFYTKPSQCEFPSTNILFTACTDDFIKAKRQFEQQYTGQALPPFQSSLALNEGQ